MNPRKHKYRRGTAPQQFVLAATKGKGKSRHVLDSSKFNQIYDNHNDAFKLESRESFGKVLFDHLMNKRKRYRGTSECDIDCKFDKTQVNRKRRLSKKEKLTRLRNLAETRQVEEEMKVATKNYTNVECIRDWQNKNSVGNFVRSLIATRDRKRKRQERDKKYTDLANRLRTGLSAGTYSNFVRAADKDDEDDVASWRQECDMAAPSRTDFSAYDLFRVQKQMLTLAVFYETMVADTNSNSMDNALLFAGKVAGVCSRTVRKWRQDFESNNYQFTERFVFVYLFFNPYPICTPNHSLSGKWTREWVLDNPLMREQAKTWMMERIKQGAKGGNGVFTICDFQTYLNTELLPSWEVPKSTLPRRTQSDDNIDASTKYLTVSWSTARSWALTIGAKFNKHKKGYYVDGHDREDVLQHRSKWLAEEKELELRQYLWAQLTVEQATKLQVPGYHTPVSTPSNNAKQVTTNKRRFKGEPKRVKKEKELSREQQEKLDLTSTLVKKELVYPYTSEDGKSMVEVHVDLLPQQLRSQLSTKLTIHGMQFDMGGNLSVRFPVGTSPLIKVGTDEIIFKVRHYWCKC